MLGALYIEKVLRQIKQAIQFMINTNSPICEKMMQISSVLTCDSQEEAEEICQMGNSKNCLSLQEVRGLYSLRCDV